MSADKENINDRDEREHQNPPKTRLKISANKFEPLLAAVILALALALAYGPDKAAGHSIYGAVIQDLTNLYGFYCWDDFSHGELLSGRFPLWNPYNAFGVPHLANMQTAIFYPINWLKWAFGFWPVIDLVLLLRLWLAGMFTWLLARRALLASFFPALLAATAYMLCGHLTRYVYMSHLNVEVLLPLQLLLVHGLAERRSRSWMAGAGAGFALLVVGGFPEATLHAFFFSALFYGFIAWRKSAGVREFAAFMPPLILAMVFGLLLSSPQWLPFAEYYPHAWTYHHAGSGLRHFDPRLSIALILPWFFGENYLSPVATFLPPYPGMVPVLLFVYLVLRARRISAAALFFMLGAVALAGLVYGVPPFAWLGRVFPFSLTYNDKYAMPALSLCVALGAGAAADLIAHDKSAKAMIAAAALLLAWTGVNVIAGCMNLFAPVWALGLLKPAMVVEAVTLAASTTILAVMRSRRSVNARTLTASLFALCLLGLVFDLRGHTPAFHDDLQKISRELKNTFAEAKGNHRIYADPELDNLFPDRLLPAGLFDLRYYDPLYPRTYVDYMAAINDLHGNEIIEHYNSNMIFAVSPRHLDSPLLALAGVGLYVSRLPMDEIELVRDWAANAVTKSSRKESWLRAEQAMAGGLGMMALIDHAPVRIEGPPLQAPADNILFNIGIQDKQVFAEGERGDGVWFMMKQGPGARLSFARYIDPKRRADELGWKPCSVALDRSRMTPGQKAIPPTVVLALLPGPRNDQTRDAAAFGMLRIKTGKPIRNLKPVKKQGVPIHVYQDDEAFPKVFWAEGYGTAKIPDDYMKDLKRISEVNINTLKKIVLLPEKPAENIETSTAKVKKQQTEFAEYLPGKIVIESAREKQGFIVVSEQLLPGWTATLQNGTESIPARIHRANGSFMTLAVPAGEWKIELIYQPPAFRIGLFAALTCLFMLPLFFLAGGKARP